MTATIPPQTSRFSVAQTGMLFAIAAYSMWGVAPIYFKQLVAVPAYEILIHRIVWSVLVLVVLLLLSKQFYKVWSALHNTRVMLTLFLSGCILGLNWWLFIWAVNNNYLLEASLGYYINPLFNVLLGFIFLGERFRRLQKVAVGLAVFGVAILIFSFGEVPYIAITLAVTFSIYGLLRKQVAVDAMPGLFIESVMLTPIALIAWLFSESATSDMFNNSIQLNTLLIMAGIVTTAPLLCFTEAARRIKYSTLGFFQYIGPSLMFCLAVWLYQEPFTLDRIITFAFVWLALGVFTYDAIRHYRRSKL